MTGVSDRRALRVGVSGHRVLADPESIAAGVDDALDRIERAHPGRILTLVSSLAEGADRLVVRRALKRRGARLVVLVPMPAAEYLDTFRDACSRREFEELSAQADACLEVGGCAAASTPEDAYAAAGEWIVGRADVLLVVWDGRAEQGRGGTGGVVARARERGLPLAWVHAGNRAPGGMAPTSLGPEQGVVTFENFRDRGLLRG